MKKGTEKQTGIAAKIGAGVRPTGVFKRIADDDKRSGVADRVRHTSPENLRK